MKFSRRRACAHGQRHPGFLALANESIDSATTRGICPSPRPGCYAECGLGEADAADRRDNRHTRRKTRTVRHQGSPRSGARVFAQKRLLTE